MGFMDDLTDHEMTLIPGQSEPTPLGTVTWVPISSLVPYDKNPRNITDKAVEQVAKSIREFGWQQPIVTDAEMVIIIGHVRRLAAKSLGVETVPVIIETRLSPDQVRALRIADNRTHDYATWDYPELLREIGALPEDFGTILDLADWQGIIEGFEDSLGESILELDPDVAQSITDNYCLTVTFEDRQSAELAAVEIMQLPGVVSVRYTGNK